MKLRYFIIFMVLFTILCLIPYPLSTYLFQHGAYAVNDKYAIRQDSEGFYIVFPHDSRNYTGGSLGPSIPTFKSVKAMKDAIIDGNISSTGMAAMMSWFPKNDSGYIKCVDLENLYDAVLPEHVTVSVIEWWGDSYYLVLPSHAFGTHAKSYITPMDSGQFRHYREYVDESFYEEGSDGHIIYLKQEQLSDRNATAHYFLKTNANGTTDYVDLWYEITAEDKTIYVQERFVLSAYQQDQAPYEINVLGKQGDAHYKLHGKPSYRPSEDMLLSFGLKPYVEAE